MEDKIKVAIVKDDRELRHLPEKLINKQADMRIIKSFSNGRSFINDFKMLDVVNQMGKLCFQAECALPS